VLFETLALAVDAAVLRSAAFAALEESWHLVLAPLADMAAGEAAAQIMAQHDEVTGTYVVYSEEFVSGYRQRRRSGRIRKENSRDDRKRFAHKTYLEISVKSEKVCGESSAD